MSFRELPSSSPSPPSLATPPSPTLVRRDSPEGPPSGFDPLQDDIFDPSFSFINNDYYASTPASPSPQSTDMIAAQTPAHGQTQGDDHQYVPPEGSAPIPTSTFPNPMMGLTPVAPVSPPPHVYNPYPFQSGGQAMHYPYPNMPYPQMAPHHSTSLPNTHGYHPYQFPTHRPSLSHRVSRSPDHSLRSQTPMMPGLGFSPHGTHYSPAAISPSLVSPGSLFSSANSDISQMQYGYSTYTGTPLSSMTNLSSASPAPLPHPGLTLIAGIPPYVSAKSPRPRRITNPATRKPRARNSAGSKASAASGASGASAEVKQERQASEQKEDQSMSGGEQEVAKNDSGAFGLTPAATASDDNLPLRQDGVKSARIQSEQRRRDELRAGFDKLRDALPQSSMRVSKVSVLDRAVSHIHQIEQANAYFNQQMNEMRCEMARLRHVNEELTRVIAAKATAEPGPGSGSSPNSSVQGQ